MLNCYKYVDIDDFRFVLHIGGGWVTRATQKQTNKTTLQQQNNIGGVHWVVYVVFMLCAWFAISSSAALPVRTLSQVLHL